MSADGRDGPDILSFECYSFESDIEMYSHRQLHHVQPMKLLYHLTDHTVSLIEPHVPNSSILKVVILFYHHVYKSQQVICSELLFIFASFISRS